MSVGKTLRCSYCSCTLVWLELEQTPEAVPDPTWMSVYLCFSLLWSANSISCSVYIPLSITPVTLQWFCRNLDLVWIWFLSSLFSTLANSFVLSALCLSLSKGCVQTSECISAVLSFQHCELRCVVQPQWFSAVPNSHLLQCASIHHPSSVPFSSTVSSPCGKNSSPLTCFPPVLKPGVSLKF